MRAVSGTVFTTASFREDRTWCFFGFVPSASCMVASGTVTKHAPMRLSLPLGRSSGKRNSDPTLNVTREQGRNCWRLVGVWQSSGNVLCGKMGQIGLRRCSTNGCEAMNETSRRHWDRGNRICAGLHHRDSSVEIFGPFAIRGPQEPVANSQLTVHQRPSPKESLTDLTPPTTYDVDYSSADERYDLEVSLDTV